MKKDIVKAALFLRRNLIALAVSFVVLLYLPGRTQLAGVLMNVNESLAVFLLGTLFRNALALAIYGGFVVQSLFSSEFRKNFEQREVINNIKKLSDECHQAARNLKRFLEPNAQQRLTNVVKESDEIVTSFMTGDKNYLKVRAVEQSLKLTLAYVKLADMFRVRASASGSERTKNASLCAVLLPIPGSVANLSIRFSSADGKKSIYYAHFLLRNVVAVTVVRWARCCYWHSGALL